MPKTDGGVAKFTDVTDTTAAAADVDSSKYFYTAAGVRTKGAGNTSGATINNQNKSVNPTESEQSVTYDNGYTGLETVTVGAIDSTYVGSKVLRKSSADLTVSGATITAPTGYYEEAASKSVSTMTLPTSAASSATSGYTSKATIGRSTSAQYINIPPGYNSAGGYYAISAVANGTAGTPTVSKGTVSNHSISITPSVTNTTGYITGGTKNGTAVTVSASELVSDTLSITSNGTQDVTNYKNVSVSVGSDINNQDKSVDPTENEQSITADTGYSGLGTVTVGAISSTYVGSEITRRSSTDLTASGATVSVPAGYYDSAVSKAISSGSATAPTSISGTAAALSTGTNTLTLTKTISITPSVSAGYINSGTAGDSSVSLTANVTVNPTPTVNGATVTIPVGYYSTQTTKSVSNGSATGPTSLSGASATISTGTNTLTLTKTNVTTTPTVSAGYISSATTSAATVALTASVTTKAAATITPTTSNQTISSGTYLTGTQTIAGDADLIAANIKNGVQIFNVTGTYTSDATASAEDIVDGEIAYVNGNKIVGSLTIQNVYVRSSAPTSSIGNDGDIYIQE